MSLGQLGDRSTLEGGVVSFELALSEASVELHGDYVNLERYQTKTKLSQLA